MNSPFTVYEQSTGKILRSGYCTLSGVSAQAGPGELVIPKESNWQTDYVDAEKIIALPSKPNRHHVFDYNKKQWIDPRTLEDFKVLKWTEIKEQRSLIEFGTFTYNSMEFDGDINAQRRLAPYISISKSMLAASQPFTAKFILANNTEVDLNAQDFVNIELVKVQQVAEAFSKSANLRTQIDNSITIDEVNSITWDYSV